MWLHVNDDEGRNPRAKALARRDQAFRRCSLPGDRRGAAAAERCGRAEGRGLEQLDAVDPASSSQADRRRLISAPQVHDLRRGLTQ